MTVSGEFAQVVVGHRHSENRNTEDWEEGEYVAGKFHVELSQRRPFLLAVSRESYDHAPKPDWTRKAKGEVANLRVVPRTEVLPTSK